MVVCDQNPFFIGWVDGFFVLRFLKISLSVWNSDGMFEPIFRIGDRLLFLNDLEISDERETAGLSAHQPGRLVARDDKAESCGFRRQMRPVEAYDPTLREERVEWDTVGLMRG
jgi:hypothetical protein